MHNDSSSLRCGRDIDETHHFFIRTITRQGHDDSALRATPKLGTMNDRGADARSRTDTTARPSGMNAECDKLLHDVSCLAGGWPVPRRRLIWPCVVRKDDRAIRDERKIGWVIVGPQGLGIVDCCIRTFRRVRLGQKGADLNARLRRPLDP